MENELTAFGNILFAAASLVGILFFHHWQGKQSITPATKTVVVAWQIKDAAVFFRIAWWILALILAPDEFKYLTAQGIGVEYVYHPWFVDHKHMITVPTSAIYVYAQYLFIQHIAGLSQFQKWGLIGCTALAAGVITWVGF